MEPRSRETRIRRDERGRWYEGDVPIDQANVEAAFARWIDLAPDGRLILKNDAGWAYVHVDGAPIFVEHAVAVGDRVELSLSDGRTEPLDPTTLATDAAGRVYARVRGGALDAVFLASALTDLVDHLEERGPEVHLTLAGRTHPIRPTASPVRARPGPPAGSPAAP